MRHRIYHEGEQMRTVRNAIRLGVAAVVAAGGLAVAASPAHAASTPCKPHFLQNEEGSSIGAIASCVGGTGYYQVWALCTNFTGWAPGNRVRANPYGIPSIIVCPDDNYAIRIDVRFTS